MNYTNDYVQETIEHRNILGERTVTTVAAEDAPMSAILDTTSMNLSEAICIFDNIFSQVFGVGVAKPGNEDKSSNMMEAAMSMRAKSEMVMNAAKELVRRLGV